MNRADLINKIANDTNATKAAATQMVSSMLAGISSALKKGEGVTLSGFGTFSTYQRKARMGSNPHSGTLIKIASRRVAKFTPGLDLKKLVARQ